MPNFVRNLQKIMSNRWGNPQHGPWVVKHGPGLLDPPKKSRSNTLQSSVLKLDQKFQLREMAHAKIVNFHVLSPIVVPAESGPGGLGPLVPHGQIRTNLQWPISSGTFKKRCQTVGATLSMDPDLSKVDLDCWTPQKSPAVLPYNPGF